MSLIGKAVRVRNAGKPPIPLGDGVSASRRGLSFNLGNGRQDAETFMRQYGMSGTIYGIISLLAESSATPAWNLYKKQPVDGRRRYSTSDQGSDQRVQVIQHPAIKLLNSPNDWHSRFEYFEGCQQHQELTGETFWVLDTEAGFPTSMWYVRPDRMEPVPDPDNFLLGWIYTGPTGEQIPLKTEEVILEKRPNPLDPYRGAGPVASILPNIQQQRYATEYQRNLFLNGADPGGVIQVPNRLTEPEFDDLVDRWRESHRGVARAGQIGVLESGAVWIPSTHSNKDMEYGELRLANRDELREAWRIHKTMMGSSDDVNRANAQTAQEVFVAWQVLPRLNRRRDTLNTKLLPLFGNADRTVEFDYEDPSPVNAETAATELLQKAQAAAALLATNRFDPRDVLEAVGLPDMDVQDVPAAAAPPAPPERAPQDRARQVINLAPPPQPQPQPAQPPQQLQTVDAQWKAAVAALVAAWAAHIMPAWITDLLGQARRLLAVGDIPGLSTLEVDSDAAATLILDHISGYAATAAKQAAAEAAAQGAAGVTPRPPTRQDLEPLARAAAALQGKQVALTAGREAARVGPGADVDDAIEHLQEFLNGLSDSSVAIAASGALSAAQNHARLATIAAGPRAQLIATEMHDGNTCAPCDDIDGKVFGYSDDADAVAEAAAAYPAGGYVLCEGGARCRGTMYADYGDRGTGNRVGDGIKAARDAQAKVFQQVAKDFPAAATAWMHHATWSGPVNVPLEHIDWTPGGMDGKSPEHVQAFVEKLRAGKKVKPVILVKTPAADELQLVDGHHRYLAASELGQPVRAFVGIVDADHGPWETMHDQQYPDPARAGASNAVNAATLSKQQVHYGPADSPGRRCGTCAMFRPSEPGSQTGVCTLVKGRIESDQVCDRWSSAGAELAALLKRILSNGHVPVQTAGRQ